MAICCPQGTQVRPKWNESDTQVTTKWHPSETKVTPKWRSSEVQVTLKRHQSDTQIYTGADTGPMGDDTDPKGPVTIIRYDHRNIMNIHSTSCTENHCKSVQYIIIYKESNLV